MANTMRLLSLPADVQGLVAEGKILAGHARALLGLPDEAAMSALAVRVAGEGLSVREVEDLVRSYAARTLRRPRRERAADPSIAEAEEILSERLSTRVLVSMGRRRGRIVVEFASRACRPEADALLCSCTAWRSVEAVSAIEQGTGKPVVSSNQSTIWTALRALGVTPPITGFGRLLESLTTYAKP